MNYVYYIFVLMVLNFNAHALTDTEIIENSVPAEFFKLDSPYRDNAKLDKDEVHYSYIKERFNNKVGIDYLIVNYKAYRYLSKLIVIQVEKNGSYKVIQTVSPSLKNTRDCEFEARDLDGDGTNEIIKNNFDGHGKIVSVYIHKWSNNSLVDITPIEKTPDFTDSLFRDLEITDFTVDGKPLLIQQGKTSLDIYQLGGKDNIFAPLGSFSLIRIVEKTDSKLVDKTFSEIELPAGLYTLEVKNLSEHKHAIRAEISVNGSVVLKPSDFCTDKPKKHEKQKDKNGKEIVEEDDDDKNEDGLKRCQFKKDAYVDVTLAVTNTINVKLYGNKHSRIQISLKKKN